MPAPSCLWRGMEIISDEDGWDAAILLGQVVELKAIAGAADSGLVEGYGATFGGVDSHADTIAPGAFADTLARHKADGTAPAMLWNHDQAQPIGKWTAAGEDGRGLRLRGMLNLQTAAGKNAHAHLMAGDVNGLSIGFRVPKGGATAGGNGGRTLRKVDLHEVSIATIPSDRGARILSVKTLGSPRDLEEVLRESGISKSVARKIVSGGWGAVSAPEVDPAEIEQFAKMIGEKSLELKRIITRGS